ncbi:RNA-binding transcriptional accessory protein [Ignatzschineria rhizosphaerae]|uniref:RNA-binding transcriptional accessory protein n=1 Tax=Ignatzschineria rhizosphaerae TaxID=2923279 RepID=A0ABY3WXA1_9GAMM|nr:Tex family protein [Ignatzschineria rhizosphaerae]UNM95229.1 RNA-binding transcriptional accessory protein [Ignatzschineria rhizosphaerae]
MTIQTDMQTHHAALPKIIAGDINATEPQVSAAIKLLDEGATVPFIARYRKEVTGGLDDTQLRLLEERLIYLRELNDRRATILNSILEQDKLSDELRARINAVDTKTALEDLYLPYRPKRRTRAQIAIEAGIEPLADLLFQNSLPDDLEVLATQYLNPEHDFTETKQVLDGARFILIERISENAELLGKLRQYLWDFAELHSSVQSGKEDTGNNYKDYFEFKENIKTIPSHRALALLRGRNEDILSLELKLPEEIEDAPLGTITNTLALTNPHDWLKDTIRLSWRAKLNLSLSLELINQLKEAAETEAIKVFARNLKDLLLASPAGEKGILGIDPGLRTGCKVAVVDRTGKLLETATIYPHAPMNKWDESLHTLAKLVEKYQPELISIGNGTASRETDKLGADLCKKFPKLNKVVTSEAGASVYSASALAAKEFPELDVSLRGAVSIARRLQDPLAELVKIEPKAIGVGQYQHDVNQVQLNRMLESVVEDCVNAVGVDANTASSALLAQVSGLNATTAQNIVNFRDENGPFKDRAALKKVPRLGPKTYELAAGFLRIRGSNPLDISAVHPEAYPVVERILKASNKPLTEIIGNSSFIKSLNPKDFVCDKFGIPTIKDILEELEKPGRDPRPEFITAAFREDVSELSDLKEGMQLEGVVTNVANFGAFVDIGVHQDGLVHISALADCFVKDPHEVVKVGDVVKVKVLEVDIPRKRIALTMRMNDPVGESQSKNSFTPASKKQQRSVTKHQEIPSNNPFAAALGKLKK